MIIDAWCDSCSRRTNHYEVCGTCYQALVREVGRLKGILSHVREVDRIHAEDEYKREKDF